MKSFLILICILFGSILFSFSFTAARELPDASTTRIPKWYLKPTPKPTPKRPSQRDICRFIKPRCHSKSPPPPPYSACCKDIN